MRPDEEETAPTIVSFPELDENIQMIFRGRSWRNGNRNGERKGASKESTVLSRA
jgi:hypothetical protein